MDTQERSLVATGSCQSRRGCGQDEDAPGRTGPATGAFTDAQGDSGNGNLQVQSNNGGRNNEWKGMNEPLHLDLFSGIGGFSLAFESAGFRTIGFSEIDDYASSVLRKHWPNVTNYGDVRNMPTVACDVITGGFPCQPFSIAGKREGAGDDRYLWPAMRDVIERCKPSWVCCENVPGIVGMELERVLADLESIKFRTQPLIIPACAVGGNHRRDRLWVVAYSECAGLQRCEQNNGICSKPRKAHTKLGDGVFAGRNNWSKHCRHLSDRDGIPHSMARHAVRAYGNAIVPQVAYQIAKAIREQIMPK